MALLALLVGTAIIAHRSASASAAAPIKLGAYVPNAPEDAGALDAYTSMVGRKPEIVMKYSNVTDPLLRPGEIANLEARGVMPMVSWQLYKSEWSGPTISLAAIASGIYDASLRRAANLAKTLPFEVMIRFGHEMNGDWYGWGSQPAAYVAAWRHIVSVFRRQGTSNVKWVWSPNVDQGSYPFARYFPGDSWVDYVALDGYNWGTSGTGVESVADALTGLLLLIRDPHADERQAGDDRRDVIERDRWGQGGVDPGRLSENHPAEVPACPGRDLVRPVDGTGLARGLLSRFASGISRRGLELALWRRRSGAPRPCANQGSRAEANAVHDDHARKRPAPKWSIDCRDEPG